MPENDVISTASVRRETDEDIKKMKTIQKYYARTSEENSIKSLYKSEEDEKTFLFDIQKSEYEEMRIDVDANFLEYKMFMSAQLLKLISQNQPVDILHLTFASLVAVHITSVHLVTGKISKLANSSIVFSALATAYTLKNVAVKMFL